MSNRPPRTNTATTISNTPTNRSQRPQSGQAPDLQRQLADARARQQDLELQRQIKDINKLNKQTQAEVDPTLWQKTKKNTGQAGTKVREHGKTIAGVAAAGAATWFAVAAGQRGRCLRRCEEQHQIASHMTREERNSVQELLQQCRDACRGGAGSVVNDVSRGAGSVFGNFVSSATSGLFSPLITALIPIILIYLAYLFIKSKASGNTHKQARVAYDRDLWSWVAGP